jgi:hypothetical protein
VIPDLGERIRSTLLIIGFAALGLLLGATLLPDSLWGPGLVLIGAAFGGAVEVAWILLEYRRKAARVTP